MFILLCSPHSFLLIELLTTSLILISFFFLVALSLKSPTRGVSLNYCIVLYCTLDGQESWWGATGSERRTAKCAANEDETWLWPWQYAFCCSLREIRNHLRQTATNSARIHSLARKYEHLRINQIQLRFLHFNQHSITLLGIHMGHWAYKREKYTFINANIKVINTILKVNRDNWHTLKCKHYSLTFLLPPSTSLKRI